MHTALGCGGVERTMTGRGGLLGSSLVCRLLGTVALGSSWHLRLFRGSEWHGSLSAVPRSLVFHLGGADAGLLELVEYWSPEPS